MNKSLKWVTLAGAAALTCVAFVACAPADLDAAKKKMEDAEYTIVMAVNGDELATLIGDEADGVVCMIVASKGTDYVQAALCKTGAKAKELYEDAMSDEVEGLVVEKSGKWVVYGSEAAVDAFLK